MIPIVLKNYLNITNNEELKIIENRLVLLNYHKVYDINQSYNFAHIQAIHLALFGNIYPFAGQLQQANMGKNIIGETYYDQQKTMFMDYKEIPYHIQFFDNYISSKNYLSDIKDKEKFAKEICEIYLFINDIHAFREGNGRTQNEFIRQLAERNGYVLDVQNLMNNYKKQGINYYSWFHEYQNTGNKVNILNNFFIDHIKTRKEYNEKFKNFIKKENIKNNSKIKIKKP